MAPISSGTRAQRRNKAESLSIIVNMDAQKSLSGNEGQSKTYGGNAIRNKYVFYWKIAIVSDVFKVMGSSFQTLGAATEKARLPKLSFVLGTISCFEIDDQSCLGISEKCRILVYDPVFL